MHVQSTPTLREMITRLEQYAAQHGDDTPVWIEDADTGWALSVEQIGYHTGPEDGPVGIYISGTYASHSN